MHSDYIEQETMCTNHLSSKEKPTKETLLTKQIASLRIHIKEYYKTIKNIIRRLRIL